MGIDVLNEVYTDMQIQAMFCDYVETNNERERHTEAACEEVEKFEAYCKETFPTDKVVQRELFDKMMDTAVEYEESGFIAGFRYAIDLVKKGKLIHS